jgi:hypothetical protein
MYYLDMLVGGEANDASASLSLVDSPSDPQDTTTTTTTTTAGKDSVQNVVAPTPVTSSVPSSSAGKRSADQAKLVAANKGDDDDDEGGGTVALTEAQIVEKRERNREHAKRSRLRKKFLLESCQV